MYKVQELYELSREHLADPQNHFIYNKKETRGYKSAAVVWTIEHVEYRYRLLVYMFQKIIVVNDPNISKSFVFFFPILLPFLS